MWKDSHHSKVVSNFRFHRPRKDCYEKSICCIFRNLDHYISKQHFQPWSYPAVSTCSNLSIFKKTYKGASTLPLAALAISSLFYFKTARWFMLWLITAQPKTTDMLTFDKCLSWEFPYFSKQYTESIPFI